MEGAHEASFTSSLIIMWRLVYVQIPQWQRACFAFCCLVVVAVSDLFGRTGTLHSGNAGGFQHSWAAVNPGHLWHISRAHHDAQVGYVSVRVSSDR
eukprot:7020675-Pyramimonas_sp.AAC.3